MYIIHVLMFIIHVLLIIDINDYNTCFKTGSYFQLTVSARFTARS